MNVLMFRHLVDLTPQEALSITRRLIGNSTYIDVCVSVTQCTHYFIPEELRVSWAGRGMSEFFHMKEIATDK